MIVDPLVNSGLRVHDPTNRRACSSAIPASTTFTDEGDGNPASCQVDGLPWANDFAYTDEVNETFANLLSHAPPAPYEV